MKNDRQSWLASPNVSKTWALSAALLWSLGLVFLQNSNLGHYLEARLARPADFWVRQWLGKSPQISSKLKIFSIDDSTFAKMGSWVLSTKDYAKLILSIAQSRPKAIVIDAMFSKIVEDRDGLDELMQKLANLDVPLITGSFVSQREIKFRSKLDISNPKVYSLARLLGQPEEVPIRDQDLPPLVDSRENFAYGPNDELKRAFSRVGHFLYQGYGKIAPLIRLSDNRVLPHLTFLISENLSIHNRKLEIDGVTLPIDKEGLLTVNFALPSQFAPNHKGMRGLLSRVERNESHDAIEAGDIVLILPQMYTGNTDFGVTPLGEIPAGFVIASMLNSILTGQWLHPLMASELLIFLCVAFGIFAGGKLSPRSFWLTLLVGSLLIMLLAIYSFSLHSLVVPWIFPLSGFVMVSLTVFAEKTRVGEKKSQTLRIALEGSVAVGELKEVLKKPEKINLEASERVVTLMFVDVVGFSLLAENMLPRMAFDNLKNLLSKISDTIHQFGGVVDKTLGDGLLCYFGYRFDLDQSTSDHAEQALRCAIKIQQDNLKRNLEAAKLGEPVYPLRIGINTASCYLGDLGSGERIDFTVVGNGVNFAKRLEGACEMHSILFGSTTNDLIIGINLAHEAVTRRFVRIKHHSELVEAYEYDPFWQDPEQRLQAVEGFRRSANIQRVHQRWPVHDPTKITVQTEFGDGFVINFSHNGLSIKIKQFLTKGTRFRLTIDDASYQLQVRLKAKDIHTLEGEVRWGYADAGVFIHGILLLNLTQSQSDYLIESLCDIAFTRVQKDDLSKASKAKFEKIDLKAS